MKKIQKLDDITAADWEDIKQRREGVSKSLRRGGSYRGPLNGTKNFRFL